MVNVGQSNWRPTKLTTLALSIIAVKNCGDPEEVGCGKLPACNYICELEEATFPLYVDQNPLENQVLPHINVFEKRT